ncbi:MAG: hypothetical protein PSW75_07875, partial [bacterium]|nr:hypothetical protein [bacterium]
MAEHIAKDSTFLAFRKAAKEGIGYVSLLENNSIQLNYGTTRIARTHFGMRKDTYTTFHPEKKCALGPNFEVLKTIANPEKLRKWLKEGKVQDELCCLGCLREPSAGRKWLIIDREAVIGFDGKPQKKKFWNSIKAQIQKAADAVTAAAVHP